MEYKGFIVDSKFIVDEIISWKNTGNGLAIIGTKGGTKYFIKKNNAVVYPTRGTATAMYNRNKEQAENLENGQLKLKAAMKGLSVDGDSIIIEENHFWDKEDNRFVTVTRFIEGAVDDEYNFSSESVETKCDIFKQMVTTIKKLHSHNVIHGDLKDKNFIFVKSGAGFRVYVLDFDASYLANDIPDAFSIPYSEGYQSPEIIKYNEGEGDEPSSLITNKTDIFSLAVIYHKLFSGSFPATEESGESAGGAILNGHNVVLDSSLDVKIGPKNGATYISLVNWMMALDTEHRPSAEQVLAVLNDEIPVDPRYIRGSDDTLFTGLWELDEKACEYSEDHLRSLGVESFKRINDRGALKYLVKKGGTDYRYTIQELIDLGFVKEKEMEIPAPWDEHDIEFKDQATLRSLGVVMIEKIEIMGQKKYLVTNFDGLKFSKSMMGLVNSGYASKVEKVIIPSENTDEPWDSDVMFAEQAVFDRRNVKSVRRYVEDGENKYIIEFNNPEKAPIVVNRNNLMLLGYLIKKK